MARTQKSIIIAVIIIIGVGLAFFGWHIYRAHELALQNAAQNSTSTNATDIHSDYYPTGVTSNASDNETAAIKDLVVSFGSKLQTVSLAASPDIAAQSITDNYSPYVTDSLLATWVANPSKAPGRQTSSPWPDHIAINSITKNPDGTFTVKGNVIELTSNEVAHGGIADSYPITLTIQGAHNVWVISAVSK